MKTSTRAVAVPRTSALVLRILMALTLASVLLSLSARADDSFSGQWFVERGSNNSTHFTIRYSRSGFSGFGWSSNSWSTDAPGAALQGLNPADLNSTSGTQVRFKVTRDAGAFDCNGWAQNGAASGHWTFVPNPAYAAELQKRGIAAPSAEEQFQMAMSNVTLAFVDALKSGGYALNLAEIIRAAKHGVNAEYLNGMLAAGYKFNDLATLTKMRDHGVDPEYVRELADAGYTKLPAEELRRMRDHGVDGEFIREMAPAGYKGLPADELVRMRDHGVNGEYLRELAEAGYRNLPQQELVRMRDHGVTGRYIQELKALGLTRLDTSDLVRMRDHAVTADFIREARAQGFTSNAPDELVRLRDRGFVVRKAPF